MKSAKFLSVLRATNKARAHLPETLEVNEKIIDLHHQGYSHRDIGDFMGVSANVIHERFKKLGIAAHKHQHSLLFSAHPRSAIYARREAKRFEPLIRECFLEKDMSAVDVGTLCGLNYQTILHYARLLNIPTQNRSQAARKRYGSLALEGPLLEILEGELLGDGCLYTHGTESARLTYGTPKGAYLKWLADLLDSYGLPGNIGGPYPVPNAQPGYSYASRRYPELTDLRARWYPHGIKRIPKDLILTPTICRHWYIGDGSMRQPPDPPYIIMCTHGFTREEVEYLAALLEPHVPGAHVGKPVKAGPPLWFGKNSALAFLEYIGPCPEPLREVYGYKWRLSVPPERQLRLFV